MQTAIRAESNPLFRVHDVVAVAALPRTASAKVMRRALRDEYVAP
jgi:acyl-coenzyme A synthetase/AMP-(fatty) acid ligase